MARHICYADACPQAGESHSILGMTDQVEDLLRRGPPSYLRELTDKLEAKGAATLERLQNWPVYDSLQTS